MEFYPWVVIAHVTLVIVAFGAHGVSAYAMLQAKGETERPRVAALLDLSSSALNAAGIGLLLAVVLGIVAAVMGGHFGRAWPWVSIALVVVVSIAMTPMAANPMNTVRSALGQATRATPKGTTPQPGSDADLAAALARLNPGLVFATGIVAIGVLVWLMELKPF